jgi:hypothetical protein
MRLGGAAFRAALAGISLVGGLSAGCAGKSSLLLQIEAPSDRVIESITVHVTMVTAGVDLTRALSNGAAPLRLPGTVVVLLPDVRSQVDLTVDATTDRGERLSASSDVESVPFVQVARTLYLTVEGQPPDPDMGGPAPDLGAPDLGNAPADLAPPSPDGDPSLVGRWDFEEGTGLIAHDTSGRGNDGTLSGPLSFVPGTSGTALMFASGDHVSVSSAASLSGMAALTVALWVRPGTSGVTVDLLSKRHPVDPFFSYDLQLMNDRVNFQLQTPTGGVSLGSSQTLLANSWYHVAAVYDGAQAQVYVNGQVNGIPGVVTGSILVTSGPLQFPFASFSGALDGVRIYSRALTANEIQHLYLSP